MLKTMLKPCQKWGKAKLKMEKMVEGEDGKMEKEHV